MTMAYNDDFSTFSTGDEFEDEGIEQGSIREDEDEYSPEELGDEFD